MQYNFNHAVHLYMNTYLMLYLLQSVHICTETMRKFINTSPLPPEQHFYPSSLAFGKFKEVGLQET